MMFSQRLNTNRIFKRLAKALIRLRICADWSVALLVAHTTLLEISCTGSNKLDVFPVLSNVLQGVQTSSLSEKIMHEWKFNISKILNFRNLNLQTCRMPTITDNFKLNKMINGVKITWKLIKEAIRLSLIQHFEADFPWHFPWKVSLKILNSGLRNPENFHPC